MGIDTAPAPNGLRPLDLAERVSDPRSTDPGSGPAVLTALTSAVPKIAVLADASSQLTDRDLTDAARVLAVLMQRAEAALVAVTADAIARGTVKDSTAAGPAQWVARVAAGEGPGTLITAEVLARSGPLTSAPGATDGAGTVNSACRVPGIEPGHASRIAKVAQASLHPSHRVLAAAVRDGSTSVAVAHAALQQVARIRTVLPTASTEEIHSWFLAVPTVLGRSGVNELTRRIIAEHGDPDTGTTLDDREAEQQRVEFLRWWDDQDGMTGFQGLLSGDHAAAFKHAITALSAPAPATSCCDDPHHRHTSSAPNTTTDTATGTATGSSAAESDREQRERLVRLADDDRTPDKRRADALMLILRRVTRWLDGDHSMASNGPTSLVVTIDHDTLTERLQAAGGSGSGTTREGLTISPTTVRRIACDAGILPLVLGTDSEPLDVGRTKRLYTGALREAVIQKYGGCTYQGCDRPADWCEIHHVIPWSHGGPTNLTNGRPLCCSHHDVVHRDELIPVTTAEGGILWLPRKYTDS